MRALDITRTELEVGDKIATTRRNSAREKIFEITELDGHNVTLIDTATEEENNIIIDQLMDYKKIKED